MASGIHPPESVRSPGGQGWQRSRSPSPAADCRGSPTCTTVTSLGCHGVQQLEVLLPAAEEPSQLQGSHEPLVLLPLGAAACVWQRPGARSGCRGAGDPLGGWVRAHPYKQSTEEGQWSERGPEGASPLLLAALALPCCRWHGYPRASWDGGDCTGRRDGTCVLEEWRSCQLSCAGEGEPCQAPCNAPGPAPQGQCVRREKDGDPSPSQQTARLSPGSTPLTTAN